MPARPAATLTPRQVEILDWIREFIVARGYSPTLGEIGERFAIHKITAHEHVQRLVEQRLLTKVAASPRGLGLAAGPGSDHTLLLRAMLCGAAVVTRPGQGRAVVCLPGQRYACGMEADGLVPLLSAETREALAAAVKEAERIRRAVDRRNQGGRVDRDRSARRLPPAASPAAGSLPAARP